MKIAILSLMLAAPAAQAAQYNIEDSGDFAPAGHRVEFADRFGWESYSVRFDFGLDEGRTLSKKSSLSIKVNKRGGGSWTYQCAGKGESRLAANINYIHAKGISVVAECRIATAEFAEAVGLHPDDVGVPNLVFHAVIQDGEVRSGPQKGLYFLPSGVVESSVLNPYATPEDDPSNLAVLFRSQKPVDKGIGFMPLRVFPVNAFRL